MFKRKAHLKTAFNKCKILTVCPFGEKKINKKMTTEKTRLGHRSLETAGFVNA